MTPADVCRCGHERAFHDSCSKCYCPWFLAPDNAGPVRRWSKERKAREAAEARR